MVYPLLLRGFQYNHICVKLNHHFSYRKNNPEAKWCVSVFFSEHQREIICLSSRPAQQSGKRWVLPPFTGNCGNYLHRYSTVCRNILMGIYLFLNMFNLYLWVCVLCTYEFVQMCEFVSVRLRLLFQTRRVPPQAPCQRLSWWAPRTWLTKWPCLTGSSSAVCMRYDTHTHMLKNIFRPVVEDWWSVTSVSSAAQSLILHFKMKRVQE